MFLDYYTRFQLVSVSGYNGMCEVTLYIEATTACRGILLIYHTLQCYHLYTTLCSAISLIYHGMALLIPTSSVLYVILIPQARVLCLIYTHKPEGCKVLCTTIPMQADSPPIRGGNQDG